MFIASGAIVKNAEAAEITVSGAASLTDAFGEIKNLFEKNNPGIVVHTNYAASNPLLRQIVEGAPVDVFASADEATMDKAVAAKVVDPATRQDFALNDLVVIVPSGSSKPVTMQELANMERIVIGNPDSVPAGRYAKSAIEHAGQWESLKDKLIMAESVRQALDYVARGEVDAGFVYRTDALHQKDKVDIAMTAEGHEPVLYPIAIATTGNNPDGGRKFIEFVLSPAGEAIMQKHGFSKP